ncbi:MAG: hypothetical protein AAGA68_22495 [Pseudomonadota bacterium]
MKASKLLKTPPVPLTLRGDSRAQAVPSASDLRSAFRRNATALAVFRICIVVAALIGGALLGIVLAGAGHDQLSVSDVYVLIGAYMVARAAFTLMVKCRLPREGIRLLLLRPFDNRGSAEVRALCQSLAKCGLCVTLSDRHYSPGTWERCLDYGNVMLNFLPLRALLASIIPMRPRAMVVRSRADLHVLRSDLIRRHSLNRVFRFALNEEWLAKRGAALGVFCADEMWREVVMFLSRSAHVVVVDASRPGPGMEWELSYLRRLGLFERVVFVHHATAEVPMDVTSESFRFDREGVTEAKALEQRIADIASRAIRSASEQSVPHPASRNWKLSTWQERLAERVSLNRPYAILGISFVVSLCLCWLVHTALSMKALVLELQGGALLALAAVFGVALAAASIRHRMLLISLGTLLGALGLSVVTSLVRGETVLPYAAAGVVTVVVAVLAVALVAIPDERW